MPLSRRRKGARYRAKPLPPRQVEWFHISGHADLRGSLTEAFRSDQTGYPFRQINVSASNKGVLRGFHHHRFQTDYWFVAQGLAQIVVSSRMSPFPAILSPHDLTYESRILGKGQGVIIPPNHAHGFLALSDFLLVYAMDHLYSPERPDDHAFLAESYKGWVIEPSLTVRSERDSPLAWPDSSMVIPTASGSATLTGPTGP